MSDRDREGPPDPPELARKFTKFMSLRARAREDFARN